MKICLLGDTGVGKTCLCRNLTGEDFDKYLEPTIGASFYSIYLKNHLDDKAHFWDTAGQERYRSLTNMYVRAHQINIPSNIPKVIKIYLYKRLFYFFNSFYSN